MSFKLLFIEFWQHSHIIKFHVKYVKYALIIYNVHFVPQNQGCMNY
jgi:hypothetical protein